MQSTNVAEEEQQFFLPDETIETDEEILSRKQRAKERAQAEAQVLITATIQEANIIPINTTSYALGAIKENARIRNEQDADIILKAIKAKLANEEHDEHLLKTNPIAQKLFKHETRIIIKDGVLMRKYYGECFQITHYQITLPTRIIPELLKTLHGATAKHPGIPKTIQECRAKHYHPGLAKHIKIWVTSCQECIKYKRINTRQIRPKMINPTDFSMGPEDILEIDILPNLPSSAGYQHIITMIDVFSRYLFAYPTQNMTAQTVGKCIIDVLTRHAYLPSTIISDKGSQFTAEVVQEISKILDIEIRHATTKHAQTIGILERTHASIKTALKISKRERKSVWHNYVQIAVMNHNTT